MTALTWGASMSSLVKSINHVAAQCQVVDYIHISTAMLTKSMNDCQDRPALAAWPPALAVEIETTNSLKNAFPVFHGITPANVNLS
jgi:hypothetical protein